MNAKTLLTLALAPIAGFAAPSAALTRKPAVIPAPARVTLTGDTGFSLAGGVVVRNDANAPFPQAVAALTAGLALVGVDASKSAGDAVVFKKVSGLSREAYRLVVTPGAVVIEASEPAGALYAAQTLVQSVDRDAAGAPAWASMTVDDAPRFAWRGMLLDPGRHFLTVAQTKRILDLMALFKLNTLHWHLTEDQGWRIEIKAYPRLTTVGSIRSESPLPGNREKGDGKPYGPFFYTQDEVRDIVAYAKARGITVIPEIELPGHAQAAIVAYPELGVDDAPGFSIASVVRWGVNNNVYAPKENTFRFIDTVIGEVAALFPDSPCIHIGGDECPKTQWEKSPFAQKVMLDNNLVDANGKPDAHRLQSWFIARVEKMVNARGKRMIGWDEIQEGGLSPTATLMVWRDWKWATFALEHGNDIIMTPMSHCYFDLREGPMPASPAFDSQKSNISLETAYHFEPVPAGTSPEKEKHILGVQASLWGEYLFNAAKLDYMAFPRTFALAEVAWSPRTGKDFADFYSRLDRTKPLLDALKVNYRKPDGAPARPEDKIVRE